MVICCRNLTMLRIFLFITHCIFLFACTHGAKNIELNVEDQQTVHEVTYDKGQQIANLAQTMLGSPYKYGGASPNGFDCSGLVFYTHGKLGIITPRTSLQQFKTAKEITSKQLRSGDLVFFKLNQNNVSHVGIYIGQGRFIHAPKSGKHVSVNYLRDEFWQPRFVSAGRLY